MPKSAAEISTAAFAIASPTLQPPPDFSEEQRQQWREIVACFNASHFDGANAPLLRLLVEHCVYSRQISEQLTLLRRICLTRVGARHDKVRSAFFELLKMAREESKTIASLSTKLRLTNSSYRTNDPRRGRADGRVGVTSAGPPPWEDRGRN